MDAIAEAGREPLELRDDRLGGVAAEPARHVRVRVHRADVSGGSLRVGDILLSDEHEGALGHAAGDDLTFGGHDLGCRTAEMHGPGAGDTLGEPGHTAVDGELDLEGGGTGTETGEGAAGACGQRVAENPGDLVRMQVEHRDVVGGKFPSLRDHPTGFEGDTASAQTLDDRRGQGAGAAGDDGPADGVTGRDDARTDAGDQGDVQALEGMCRDAEEECSGAFAGEGMGNPGGR